jgi:hypothetical protein
MDTQAQRIAELEAEVHRLRAIVEAGEVRIKRKLQVTAHRAHGINDVIREAKRRNLACFLGGLGLLARLTLACALIIGAIYLVDYVRSSGKWPGLNPDLISVKSN